MKARRIAVLALIALVLPLGVAQAATNGCNPAVDLFGCIVSGSGSVGLQVENTQFDGIGVYGQSDGSQGSGVHGYASYNGAGSEAAGVFGYGSGGSVGVYGASESGRGVSGTSTSGVGVYGSSTSGFAMEARGNTTQARSNGGWVKALVQMQGSALSRCYNSQSTSNPMTCNGFSIAGGSGNYTITFPFRVNDRYVVITTESVANSPRCCMIQYDFPANNQVRVRTWDHNGTAIDRAFSLVVF